MFAKPVGQVVSPLTLEGGPISQGNLPFRIGLSLVDFTFIYYRVRHFEGNRLIFCEVPQEEIGQHGGSVWPDDLPFLMRLTVDCGANVLEAMAEDDGLGLCLHA